MGMIRIRRKNTAWLTVMGLVIAFALLAGVVTPPIQLTLLAVFLLATIASMVSVGTERQSILSTLRRTPIRQRMSPQAREAVERARNLGGYLSSGLTMLDMGVIASQSSYEGMAMRRTRAVSKDDDGVRPFITLSIDPEDADRNAVVRFEILDQYGEQVYVHEMKAFLRDGELSIMADHHLPLAGNSSITGTGDWDLRVFIDGNLAAVHNFTMSPSINERSRRLAGDYIHAAEPETEFDIIDEVPQEIAPSLQELLKQGGGSSSGGSGSASSARSSNTSSSNDTARRVTTTPRRRR
jgi:hypothetical protein